MFGLGRQGKTVASVCGLLLVGGIAGNTAARAQTSGNIAYRQDSRGNAKAQAEQNERNTTVVVLFAWMIALSLGAHGGLLHTERRS